MDIDFEKNILNNKQWEIKFFIHSMFYGVISKELKACDINNKINNQIMLMKSTT